MRRTRILLSVVAILLPALVAGSGEVLAQAPAVKAGLILQGSRATDGRLVYMWNNRSQQKDPIRIILSLENVGTSGVLVPSGFSGKPFILDLVFIDPDGKGVTASGAESHAGLHVPPVHVIHVDGIPVQVQPVESLPGRSPGPSWALEITLPNAHTYYSLSKVGRYSVKAVIPMTTYQGVAYPDVAGVDYARLDGVEWTGTIESNVVNFAVVDDRDCDGYFAPEGCGNCPPAGQCSSTLAVWNDADCDDLLAGVHPGVVEIACNGRDDDCNPLTPDQPPGVVCSAPLGTIKVAVEKHTVGVGNYPTASKQPLPGVPMRVFDKSKNSCAASKYGVSWQKYPDIWKNCEAVVNMQITAPPPGTVPPGTATFNVPAGDYLMIGMYDPNPFQSGDEIYIGNSVGSVAVNQTKQVYLQVIMRADQSLVPAKYVIKTGSELLIIQPEYIEWDQTQELYPFIFQTVGDWGVATAITPPEGFVADKSTLSVNVKDALKAVQFVVTDVGSDWVDTNVEYTITYKNKKEKVKEKIGVKKKNKDLK
jgi:hypothetical protein